MSKTKQQCIDEINNTNNKLQGQITANNSSIEAHDRAITQYQSIIVNEQNAITSLTAANVGLQDEIDTNLQAIVYINAAPN